MSIFQSVAFPLSAQLRGSTALSGINRHRGRLIASLLVVSALGAAPAYADGGRASGTLVNGGADSNTGAGSAGGNGTGNQAGGGGGGAGASGGAGGIGDGNGNPAAAGGVTAGANGTNGAGGANANGGGGGAHGYVGGPTPGVAVTGGNGGDGGAGTLQGGGGGAGGYGAVVSGGGLRTVNVAITGGNGGAGGTGGSDGSSGGSGGHGLVMTSSATLFVLGTTLRGGNGGAGQPISFVFGSQGGAGGDGLVISNSDISNTGIIAGGNGATGFVGNGLGGPGAGGSGIRGAGLTVANTGTISGGLGGDGVTRANAVTFTGGTNVLRFYSGATFIGNVVAGGASDTFRLDGSTNGNFDVSQLGSAAQYRGFETFALDGGATWTLTGTNSGSTPWTIGLGTLSISSDGALGATSGAVTFNGGTLATTATFSSARNMAFSSAATIDVATGTMLTLDGALSSSGSLTKTGDGTLVVTAANSRTGTTTVSAGTLALQNSGTPGSGAITVLSGGTLTTAGISMNNAVTLWGAGSGGAGALQAVSGTSSLSGSILMGTDTTIGVGGGATLSLTGSVNSVNTGLTLTGAGTGSIAAISLGTGGLVKADSGNWTLTAANTYSGGTVINSGTLALNSTATLGSGTVSITSGGTLSLSGATVTNAISLAGYGVGSAGTIRSVSGTSTVSGTVTLVTDSLISVSAGATLSLTGSTAVAGTNNLVLDGDGTGSVGAMALGTGRLIKNGTGTWTLTSANTHSGGTTVSDGTLRVQNDGALGTGALTFNGGTLAAGANVTLANNVTLTGAGFIDAATNGLRLSGNISGVTALTFSSTGGLGTFVLSGNNSGHTGTTTVSATALLGAGSTTGLSASSDYTIDGGLILAGFSNTVRSLSGAGGVRNSNATTATLTIAPSAGSTTFSGVISDGGSGLAAFSLIKTGAGTQVLTGANTYTGTTTINGGTLAVTGAGSLGATAVTVNAGGTLQADGAMGGGGIGAAASVTLNAGGSFIVDGAETVGSLAGAGGATLNATLTTGGDNSDTTYSGVASNVGGLTKTGTGRVILSGLNTYNGATTVNDGVLEVGTTGAISSATTVTAGGFVVNGTASGVTIDGGFLGGTGTVGGVMVNAGGMLAPGNSIGTLNVTGNLGFAAGATFAVEVSPATADRVNVTGTATLGNATVAASYAPGQYIQRQYTIVNATGGIVGTFSGVTGTAPTGFTQSLAYDGNNAYLVLSLIMAGGGGGNAPGPYGNLDQNQLAVAQAITAAFIANGGIDARFGALDANGLTQTSGEPVTGAMGAGFDAAGQFMGVIGQPGTGGGAGNGGAPLGYTSEGAMLGYAVDAVQAVDGERRGRTLSSNTALAALAGENEDAATKAATSLAMSGVHNADDIIEAAFATRWKLWGAAYGGGETVRGNATVGSNTLTASTWGVASGVSRTFDGGSLGIALGGSGTSFSLANGLGGGNATSFNAGIHGTVNLSDAAYLSGALAYGYHATRTTRNVPGDTLSGRFGAHTFSGRAEAGYRLNLGGVELTPYGAVEATVYNLPAYAETSANGGPFALAFGRQSQTNVRTELGARTAIDLGSGVKLTGRAAWVWNAQNGRAVSAAFQALPGTTFTVNGAAPARHAALLDLGLEAALADNLSAKLSFTGEFSRNVSAYGAAAKLSYRW